MSYILLFLEDVAQEVAALFGSRVSESGDRRITEDGNVRITEG